jgi:acyl carrier protein
MADVTTPKTVGVIRAVAEEMGTVLSCPPLGASDDFFLSGGDSLRAVELISRLSERYAGDDADTAAALGSAMLIAVFDEPTPDGLAAALESALDQAR